MGSLTSSTTIDLFFTSVELFYPHTGVICTTSSTTIDLVYTSDDLLCSNNGVICTTFSDLYVVHIVISINFNNINFLTDLNDCETNNIESSCMHSKDEYHQKKSNEFNIVYYWQCQTIHLCSMFILRFQVANDSVYLYWWLLDQGNLYSVVTTEFITCFYLQSSSILLGWNNKGVVLSSVLST